MLAIDRTEILPIGEYETIRERFRARVIAEKRHRRVELGAHLSVLFENRDTVMLQIQEMLRTERITSESGIRHEIDTYNELIPGAGQVSVTLFVAVPEREERERLLRELALLEESVGLEVDGEVFRASGKRLGAEPDRTTAVHYLKIQLSPGAAEKVRTSAARLAMRVDHQRYQARTELSVETAARLAEDVV